MTFYWEITVEYKYILFFFFITQIIRVNVMMTNQKRLLTLDITIRKINVLKSTAVNRFSWKYTGRIY